MVWAWSTTVDALIAEGAKVSARCPHCDVSPPVDLEKVRAEMGGLYSFWNRHPPCRSCGRPVYFIALRPNAGVWATQMKGADPVQIDILHARWRADRLGRQIGGSVGLQVMLGMVKVLTRYGLFTREERARLVADAIEGLPGDLRDDARWLIEHHISRDEPPPGWR